MSQAPGMNFNLSGNESFKIEYEFLKTRVKYVFQNRKLKDDTWCVSYWSVKICRSKIMKHGTEEDKVLLPQGTAIDRKRKPNVQVLTDGRVVKRVHKTQINKNTNKTTRLILLLFDTLFIICCCITIFDNWSRGIVSLLFDALNIHFMLFAV